MVIRLINICSDVTVKDQLHLLKAVKDKVHQYDEN
jgi:hypothetical protein